MNGIYKKDLKIKNFVRSALQKMFDSVGREYSEELCKTPDWYLLSTWTIKQEEAFRDWFVHNYIKTFKAGRNEANNEWGWFNLQYGWKRELSK